MNKAEEYLNKVKAILAEKRDILIKINLLFDRFRKIEEEEKELSDNEFRRTGMFSSTVKLNITITENDMLQDLIKKTEGKNITPEEPNTN